MPDRHDSMPDGADPRVVELLREMPLARPGTDGWPRMAALLRARAATVPNDLPARGRRPRWARGWPLAAAAAVLAAVLLPGPVTRDPPVAGGADALASVEAGAPAEAPLTTQALIAQSQWLERLVAADAIDAVAQDADQLIIEQGLRSRIQRIDAALVDSGANDQRLWAARVGTLTQLAEVKWAGRQGGWASTGTDSAGRIPAVMWAN